MPPAECKTHSTLDYASFCHSQAKAIAEPRRSKQISGRVISYGDGFGSALVGSFLSDASREPRHGWFRPARPEEAAGQLG